MAMLSTSERLDQTNGNVGNRRAARTGNCFHINVFELPGAVGSVSNSNCDLSMSWKGIKWDAPP